MRRHGVDVEVVHGQVGVRGSDVAAHLQEQPGRPSQDVGLVHDGEPPPTSHRQPARLVRCPLDRRPGENPDGECDVDSRHQLTGSDVHVAVGVEPLRVLPDDDEIHSWADCGNRRVRPRGPNVGVQVEVRTELATGVAALPVFLGIVRRVVRTQHEAVARREGAHSSRPGSDRRYEAIASKPIGASTQSIDTSASRQAASMTVCVAEEISGPMPSPAPSPIRYVVNARPPRRSRSRSD